jgi:hypothetical protein
MQPSEEPGKLLSRLKGTIDWPIFTIIIRSYYEHSSQYT